MFQLGMRRLSLSDSYKSLFYKNQNNIKLLHYNLTYPTNIIKMQDYHPIFSDSLLPNLTLDILKPIQKIHEKTQNWLNDALVFIKRTYQPKVIKRKRKHGFLNRKKSVGGRNILARRFNKERKRLSA